MGHVKWIKQNEKALKDDAKIITVVITNTEYIEKSAVTFADGLLYWNLNDFKEWAVLAISVVRELRKAFDGTGNLIWRNQAMNALKDAKLTPNDLLAKLERQLLKNLKRK